MFKIAIGIPSQGTIKSKTALSLIETARLNSNVFPIFTYGGYIAENREKLVKIAIDNGCTHIFFVDHDMFFNGDTLERLLSHNKDVVGVLYNMRRLPLEGTTKFWNDKGETVNSLETMPTEAFKVPAVGMGCTLINLFTFHLLPKPWFPMESNEDGVRVLTEDIGFCEKVRDAGFEVWVDPTISVKHIGDYAY